MKSLLETKLKSKAYKIHIKKKKKNQLMYIKNMDSSSPLYSSLKCIIWSDRKQSANCKKITGFYCIVKPHRKCKISKKNYICE